MAMLTSWVLDSREAITAAAENQTDWTTVDRMKLTLRDCHVDTTVAAMVIVILRKNQSRIQELVLDNCRGRHLGTILTVALTNFTMLDSISILVSTSDFDSFAHSLGVGLLTNSSIRKIRLGITSKWNSNFSSFSMTLDAAKSLQQGLGLLSTLHVQNCRFAAIGPLRIFASGLQNTRSLRDVRVASCYEPNGQPLEDHNVAALLRALEFSSELECLDITGNKCLALGMEALASLLEKTKMRKLNVSSQQMDQSESMDTFPLVGALARSLTLESLELRSNNLSSVYDMANIAAALTHNTSVKLLDLADNHITSSAMNILSSRIPSMLVLENLRIDRNYGWNDETSKNLANAMKENLVISKMDCDPNLKDYTTIQYYADLNWARRLLKQNSIPSKLWPKILSRIGRLPENSERQANVIYFFLQQDSAMLPM